MVRASGLALRLAVAVAACALVVRGDEFDAPTPRPAASPAKKPSASDGADPVSDEIWTTMTISATAFVALSLLFDLLRSHLWWVYGPRLHHAKYRAATPPDPGPGPFRWVAAVARLWSDAEFLEYAGVDGLVMIQFLNFAADQAFFAALVGCAVLVPTYVTARGLRDAADDDDASYGFSLTTVSNIHCAKKDALGKQPLFPKCLNQNSNWRFAVVVAGAWRFAGAELASSTRLQCDRVRKCRREVFRRASRTRREPSIRPKISRIDVDAAELERSESPKPAVDFGPGSSRSAR